MYTATNSFIYIVLHMMILSCLVTAVSFHAWAKSSEKEERLTRICCYRSIIAVILRRNTNSVFISATEWIEGQFDQVSKTPPHANRRPGTIEQRKNTSLTCIRLSHTEKKSKKAAQLWIFCPWPHINTDDPVFILMTQYLYWWPRILSSAFFWLNQSYKTDKIKKQGIESLNCRWGM